jgi:hypothetical protein
LNALKYSSNSPSAFKPAPLPFGGMDARRKGFLDSTQDLRIPAATPATPVTEEPEEQPEQEV